AILPGRTSEKRVEEIILLLHANYFAVAGLPNESIHMSQQMRFAAGDNPYPVSRNGVGEKACGGNPWLVARRVFDLTVFNVDGLESMEWEQEEYPTIDPKKPAVDQFIVAMPFPRSHWRFDGKNNTMTRLESQGATDRSQKPRRRPR